MFIVPEPIRLIGNPEENFYILGKKHQSAYQAHHARLFPSSALSQPLGLLKKRWGRETQPTLPDNTWAQWLAAYCEGLETSPSRYLALLEKLEAELMVRSGHTSVLRWDEASQGPQHLRLLDWAGAQDEAAVEWLLIAAPHKTSLLLICLPGLAFLPLTAMNAHGLTLAVHAKYGTLQHSEGRPISEAVVEGLLHALNVNELRKSLKSFHTQRPWGLIACDPGGGVLAMDIQGPVVDVVQSDLREAKLLAFSGAALVKNKDTETASPPHFADFSRARREWCLERLRQPNLEAPLYTLTRAHKLSRVPAPAVGVSTVQAFMLHPTTRGLTWSLGQAPLWQQGQMLSWQDLFATQMRQPREIKHPFPKEERSDWSIRRHYTQAQRAMDQGRLTEAFHHLQMGLAQAQGELKALGRWVWAWWQWRALAGRRDRLHLYLSTEALLDDAVASRPLVQLLRLILEVELNLVATVTPLDLPTTLRAWSEAYLTTPKALRQGLSQSLEARLDIQDLAPLALPSSSGTR